MQSLNNDAIKELNSLLQGELSAVETYGQALDAIKDPSIKMQLVDAQSCHARRVAVLRDTICESGGKPAESSGVWGAFAKTMEGGSALLGETAAIDMLEEGEDKGLDQYRKLCQKAMPGVQPVVERLMPRQQETHDKLSAIKHTLH